ncbi:MAG: hypothetical protein WKF47_15420 [Geodermatophilaceae bacterium]
MSQGAGKGSTLQCRHGVSFHAPSTTARARKERLVNEGRAHAALVFDGDEALAWCEYGTPEELPHIYHRKEHEAGLDRLPDYRLTCFFVDKKYRSKGMAGVARHGALHLIGQAGGGLVEAYPQDTDGQKVSASLLYNGTRSLSSRPVSATTDLRARATVMSRAVPAA